MSTCFFSEDHDVFPCVYDAGNYTITEDGDTCGCGEAPCTSDDGRCMAIGTPLAFVLTRTLTDPSNQTDMQRAREIQDQMEVGHNTFLLLCIYLSACIYLYIFIYLSVPLSGCLSSMSSKISVSLSLSLSLRITHIVCMTWIWQIIQPGGAGEFNIPNWNQTDLTEIRDAILRLTSTTTTPVSEMFGFMRDLDRCVFTFHTSSFFFH